MAYKVDRVRLRAECQSQFVKVRKGVPKLAWGFKVNERRYTQPFNGHFILLVGYATSENGYWYLDPAKRHGMR